jgi:aryl-alcohol dehydrogenase-like predicted oxidoreductase
MDTFTTRRIGDIEVSIAGLGCNNFGRRIDEARTQEVVAAALDAGVTVFDTADLYGDGASEEFLGRALGAARDRAVVVTKFGMRTPPNGLTGGDPRWVAQACDQSLERLGTDRIDVYLFHQPDPAVPITETLDAMRLLVDKGKVREVGCSNVSAAQIAETHAAALAEGWYGFATVQNEFSLLEREAEGDVLPACERAGITFMPYFPLASGLLTGKYRRGETPPPGTRLSHAGEDVFTDQRFGLVERLEAYANDHGHSLLELALSWLASHSAVATVIAGATGPDQVRANASATTAWHLSEEELREVAAVIG